MASAAPSQAFERSPRRVVVLLHGLLNDGTLWQAQKAALGSRAEVITPDFATATSLTALARSVLAAAPERFAIAGFSMGGYVACEIARIAPDRIAGLCLLATTSLPDAPTQRAARMATIASVEQGGFAAAVEAVARHAVWPGGSHATVARAALLAMARRAGPGKFAAHLQAVAARPDSTEVLAALRCPIAIARGDRDRIVPQDAVAVTAAALGVSIATVADAGHMLPLEAPEQTSDLLHRWLDDVWREPGAESAPRGRSFVWGP